MSKCTECAHDLPVAHWRGRPRLTCSHECSLVRKARGGDAPHGSQVRYNKGKCRCDLCRATQRARHLATYVPKTDRVGTGESAARKTMQARGDACHICGDPIDYMADRMRDPQSFSVDHVLPRSLGGRTTVDNLAAAHRRCNLDKGGGTPAAGAALRELVSNLAACA